MDCGYYIVKVLHIYFNETVYIVHELDKYDENITEIQQPLNPIILYDNSIFLNLSYETKYKTLVEKEIKKYNIKWSQIYRILMVDEKYQN